MVEIRPRAEFEVLPAVANQLGLTVGTEFTLEIDRREKWRCLVTEVSEIDARKKVKARAVERIFGEE